MSRGRFCFPLLSMALCLLSVHATFAQGKSRPRPPEPREDLGSISLQVVDVADGRAYVEPGSESGLRSGDEVRFGRNRFKVAAISRASAVIVLGRKSLAVGQRGSASVRANRPERFVPQLARPAPLATLRGELQPPTPPARTQHPTPVPLAAPVRPKNQASLSTAVYAVLPADGAAFVGNELRGRLHYEPYTRPLALDLDLALQSFFGADFARRPGAAARQLLRVRALNVSYGTATDFRGVLGRLRAASALVGQLDGARLEARLNETVRVSAFAGTVPHTFNGNVSGEVGRFGGELVYQDVKGSWRPRLLLGGYASRFDGALDERRAYASFDLLPPRGRIGGHTELSFFDRDNPWNASATEITAARLDANFEIGAFHFGGQAEMRRPDRSRWLGSLLPGEWLCWAAPASPQAPCLPGDASYQWLANGGVRLGKFSVDWGGQSRFTRGTDATNFGAFASLRWLDVVGRMHFDFGTSAFTGSVLRSTALVLAPGLVFWEGAADISVSYRPALVRHRAELRSRMEHNVGAALWLSPLADLDIQLTSDWIRGSDVNALLVQGVAAWRFGF